MLLNCSYKNFIMYKLIPLCIFCFLQQLVFTQTANNINAATIEITLTNNNKQPLQNEKIMLSAPNNKKNYLTTTNNKGEASVVVNAGYTYIISLLRLHDTTKYGDIEIAELAANQKYAAPFKIDMMYEPAKSYTFHHLEFDIAKSVIKPASFTELDLLVEYMQLKAEVNIEIVGHTDNKGSATENQKLSLARAESVKNYLVKKGIAATRMKTAGMGDAEPVADNSTEAGRQKNRRTEIKFND